VSEPKRYNEEMVNISNGDPCGEIEFDYSASMVEAFEGRWVAWEDYAELKAEAERYRLASLRVDVSELHAQFNRALFDDTIAENARLKAEVERLMVFCNCTLIPNKELQAKVERLTKAGDEMARVVSSFGFDEAPIAWNRAKEGKPRD
jgi:hypothetical protein